MAHVRGGLPRYTDLLREAREARSVAPASAPPPPAAPPGRGRAWRRAAGLIAVSVAALSWWVAQPAATGAGAVTAPPEWSLRLSAPGRTSPLVLVYGPEAGVHIMRTPAASGAGVRSIGLVDRELRIISLGWSPVAVRGDAAGAGALRSFGAQGRVITAYRDAQGAGVRTGF